jgi:hypothetical protein
LWDVASGKECHPPAEQQPSLKYCVAFSPDGRTFATSSGENQISIWDAVARLPNVGSEQRKRSPRQLEARGTDQAPKPRTEEVIRRLITELDDDVFAVRESAAKRLAEIGQPALPALRKAAQSATPETRERARAVLSEIEKRMTAEQKNAALRKCIDLGTLGEYFKLTGVDRVFDPQRGGSITLRLEATKEVDTSRLNYKIGFFDQDNSLRLSSDIRFEAAFPLQPGESVKVICWEGREPQEWKKIVIRKGVAGASKK